MSLRVVMMGTGTFALPIFRALIDSDHDVAGLVTQPDRVGRGHHRHLNELKELAIEREIPVFQPDRANSEESLSRLREFGADLFVVAAYGQILSSDLLQIPRLGAINLHGSLLPKYRGAAPVQFAVLNGEKESGVTIFQIEPKLDAGPVLGVVKTDIGPKETSGSLHDRLAELAVPLTLDVLHGLDQGSLVPETQDTSAVTKAPKIRKEQGLIDWHRPSDEITWHVFGMQPWPMPFTFLTAGDRSPMRILILDVDRLKEEDSQQMQSLSPGDLLQSGDRLFVKTGDSGLEILSLQPAGKRRMSASEFLRGTNVSQASLGSET